MSSGNAENAENLPRSSQFLGQSSPQNSLTPPRLRQTPSVLRRVFSDARRPQQTSNARTRFGRTASSENIAARRFQETSSGYIMATGQTIREMETMLQYSLDTSSNNNNNNNAVSRSPTPTPPSRELRRSQQTMNLDNTPILNPTRPRVSTDMDAALGALSSSSTTITPSPISPRHSKSPESKSGRKSTASSLNEFIYKRGFLEGACSDVTVNAFGKSYAFHKLILDRSSYFSSLFGGLWQDSDARSHELDFSDDPNITKEAFELAIARLYGVENQRRESEIATSMIAIGSYLDLPDVVYSGTEWVVRSLDTSNLLQHLTFSMSNNYGQASDRIIDSCKGCLSIDGWQIGAAKWDGIPESIIADVVGSDSFFVPSEWDRCIFIIELIERRLLGDDNVSVSEEGSENDSLRKFSDTASDIESSTHCIEQEENGIELLRTALNTKVHYCHMSPEDLQELDGMKDPVGKRYVNKSVLREALWLQVNLHQKIASAPNVPKLGLAIPCATEPDEEEGPWYTVPESDATVSGTPDVLKKQILNGKNENSSSKSSSKRNLKPEQSNKLFTKFPPYRFSIAFTNISKLKIGKRVYTQTFWYAGSYWNLYITIQRPKSDKGFQMGVYLHRVHNNTASSKQSSSNIASRSSSYMADRSMYDNRSANYIADRTLYDNPDALVQVPDVTETDREGFDLSQVNDQDEDILGGDGNDATRLLASWSTEVQQPNFMLRSVPDEFDPELDEDVTALMMENLTMNNTQSQQNSFSNSHYTFKTSMSNERSRSDGKSPDRSASRKQSILTYNDPRSVISVYFVIYTPSRKRKASLTCFSSSPDLFNLSQSWGWRSNSMCSFNEDGTLEESHNRLLKFMVVLGQV